MKKNNKQIIW